MDMLKLLENGVPLRKECVQKLKGDM